MNINKSNLTLPPSTGKPQPSPGVPNIIAEQTGVEQLTLRLAHRYLPERTLLRQRTDDIHHPHA